MSWFATLPDGFIELTAPLADPMAIAVTVGGLVLIAVLGLVALRLATQADGRSRIVGRLSGLLAALVAVAIPIWWVVEAGVPVAVVLLTGAGVGFVAVCGLLAYLLGRRPSNVARAAATLGGLLALAVLGVLAVWWTVGVRVASDIGVALWEFGDRFIGVVLMIGSLVLTALFCALAYRLRERQGWLSALFGTMAALLSSWWLLGIIPSAWVYFVDSQSELLADRAIPSQIIVGTLEIATNFYNVFRDSIVLVQGGIVVVGYFALALILQKRFPGGLAEGEERGPTTGGYK